MRSGSIQVAAKGGLPSPPATGQQVKKCMLAWMHDCGGGISGDHIVSASILRQITVDRVEVRGSGFARSARPESDSLKVKRLCRRHNSALSAVDAEAGRFFRGVQAFNEAIVAGRAVQTRLLLFHSFDLERWLLKTMLATYFARLSNVTPSTFQLPQHAARLFQAPIAPPYGLFIPTKSLDQDPRRMVVGRHVELSLITEGEWLCGVQVALGGVELRFVIAGHPSSLHKEHSSGAYRPKFINLFSGQAVYTLGIASQQDTNTAVWLSPNKDAALPVDPQRPSVDGATNDHDGGGPSTSQHESSA